MTTNETLKGALFGAVGGAVGTYLMSYYWKAAEAVHGHDPRELTNEEPPHEMDDISAVGDQTQGEEASTEAVGRIVYEKATGHAPSEERKEKLSLGVHWSYGVVVSALYGAVRGRRAMPDAAGGAAFGTALWMLGDELMVPLLGLSRGPTAYPAEQHLHRWGAHLFYGIFAAATTQGLFRAFAPAPTRTQLALDAVKTYATWKTLKSVLQNMADAGRSASGMGARRKSSGIQGAIRNSKIKMPRMAANGVPRMTMRNLGQAFRPGPRMASA